MSNDYVHPIFKPILDNIMKPSYMDYEAKNRLRESITEYLENIHNPQSSFAEAIRTTARNNFQNVVDLILHEYKDAPEDVTECIGEVPMQLILKYSQL